MPGRGLTIFPSRQSAQSRSCSQNSPVAHRQCGGVRVRAVGAVPLLLAKLARRSQTMRRCSRQGRRHSGPGAVAPFVPLYAALPPAYGSGQGGLPSRLSVFHTRSSGCLPRSASGIRPHAQKMRRYSRQGCRFFTRAHPDAYRVPRPASGLAPNSPSNLSAIPNDGFGGVSGRECAHGFPLLSFQGGGVSAHRNASLTLRSLS